MNKEVLNLLKTSRGQIDAITRMVEDDRYCVDILKQMLAVQGLMKKANLIIIDNHIRYCVSDAVTSGKGDEKVTEIMTAINKYSK